MNNAEKFTNYLDKFFIEIYDSFFAIDDEIKKKKGLSAQFKNWVSGYFRKNSAERFLGDSNAETTGICRGVIGLSIFFGPHCATPPDPSIHHATRFIEFFGENRDQARMLLREYAGHFCARFHDAIFDLRNKSLEELAFFIISAICAGISTSPRHFQQLDTPAKQNLLFKFALPPRGAALYQDRPLLQGEMNEYSIEELVHDSDIQVLEANETPIYTRDRSAQSAISYGFLFSCFNLATHQSIPRYIPNQRLQTVNDAVDGIPVLTSYRRV